MVLVLVACCSWGWEGNSGLFLWFGPRAPARKEDGPRLGNLSSQEWIHWQPGKSLVSACPSLPGTRSHGMLPT